MGKPPAVLIVVRHGARLDAADKQWHLTSPTPYDPPLTYGGWTQSRALGARIAALLQARAEAQGGSDGRPEAANDNAASQFKTDSSAKRAASPLPRQRPRKHKIILHSSPFLRCVQTSIAIGAGMSQYHGLNTNDGPRKTSGPVTSVAAPPERSPSRSQRQHHRQGLASSPLSTSPGLSAIKDDEWTSSQSRRKAVSPRPFVKPRLRLDAFLGEWLSPDYWDSITPPPGSVLMVASAKAELLRRGDYVDAAELNSISRFNFPGGWGSEPAHGRGSDLSSDISELSLGATRRDRATTHDSMLSPGNSSKSPRATYEIQAHQQHSFGYMPPQPRYAISATDPIPIGYASHARDACIDVDYQWDSMRPPQDWGNGGEYGEEWSSMHKRFRRGLQKMIGWYRIHHDSPHQAGGHLRVLHPPVDDDDGDDEENSDTVLIIVTHGAGCNALLGALTNQPVLIDVGLASLTMAVRKEDEPSSRSDNMLSSPQSPSQYSHSWERPLSFDYTVSLTASTDHLRTGSNPLIIPLLQSVPSRSGSITPTRTGRRTSASPASLGAGKNIPPRYRKNNSSIITSSPINTPVDASYNPSSFQFPGSAGPSPSAMPSLSRQRTPMSPPAMHRSATSAIIRSSTGLWSNGDPQASAGAGESGDDWNMSSPSVPSVPLLSVALQGNVPPARADGEEVGDDNDNDDNDDAEEFDEYSATGGAEPKPISSGLWSSVPDDEVRDRERRFKRRWTLHDQRQQ